MIIQVRTLQSTQDIVFEIHKNTTPVIDDFTSDFMHRKCTSYLVQNYGITNANTVIDALTNATGYDAHTLSHALHCNHIIIHMQTLAVSEMWTNEKTVDWFIDQDEDQDETAEVNTGAWGSNAEPADLSAWGIETAEAVEIVTVKRLSKVQKAFLVNVGVQVDQFASITDVDAVLDALTQHLSTTTKDAIYKRAMQNLYNKICKACNREPLRKATRETKTAGVNITYQKTAPLSILRYVEKQLGVQVILKTSSRLITLDPAHVDAVVNKLQELVHFELSTRTCKALIKKLEKYTPPPAPLGDKPAQELAQVLTSEPAQELATPDTTVLHLPIDYLPRALFNKAVNVFNDFGYSVNEASGDVVVKTEHVSLLKMMLKTKLLSLQAIRLYETAEDIDQIEKFLQE